LRFFAVARLSAEREEAVFVEVFCSVSLRELFDFRTQVVHYVQVDCGVDFHEECEVVEQHDAIEEEKAIFLFI
jgi:hypothetical protein